MLPGRSRRSAARSRGGPPAYALGGVTAADVTGCVAAGAYGVAVMGAVMRAEAPERVVAELDSALQEVA